MFNVSEPKRQHKNGIRKQHHWKTNTTKSDCAEYLRHRAMIQPVKILQDT